MLIDDILELRNNPRKMLNNFDELPDYFWSKFIDERKPHVFNITNINEYMTLKMKDGCNFSDFPNIAPVYGSMWTEFAAKSASGVQGRVGALLSNAEFANEQEAISALRDFKMYILMKYGTGQEADFLAALDVPTTDLKWMTNIALFQQNNNETVFAGTVMFLINSNGDAFSASKDKGVLTSVSKVTKQLMQHDIALQYVRSLAAPTLLALTFLHAKGIKEHEMPPPSRQVRRFRERHGQLPLFRHYVLVLDLPKKIIQDGNKGSDELSPQAFHMVRGHFKHFSDKPLFGKYKGSWFWVSHAAGSKAAGEITKDYEIRVPKE